MADPFLGEIRMMGFNFPPIGWAKCDGAILNITQNQALYALLGTRYGGDGRTTFCLPDLRGRAPLHRGTGYTIGEKGGAEQVTLTTDTIPGHNHVALGTTANGDAFKPADNRSLATSADSGDPIYGAAQALTAMNTKVVTATGGGLPHNNMQPSLTINFCIATTGMYPPRS